MDKSTLKNGWTIRILTFIAVLSIVIIAVLVGMDVGGIVGSILPYAVCVPASLFGVFVFKALDDDEK